MHIFNLRFVTEMSLFDIFYKIIENAEIVTIGDIKNGHFHQKVSKSVNFEGFALSKTIQV